MTGTCVKMLHTFLRSYSLWVRDYFREALKSIMNDKSWKGDAKTKGILGHFQNTTSLTFKNIINLQKSLTIDHISSFLVKRAEERDTHMLYVFSTIAFHSYNSNSCCWKKHALTYWQTSFWRSCVQTIDDIGVCEWFWVAASRSNHSCKTLP